MTETVPLTAADVAAVAGNRNNGYGCGYGAEWIWIIVLFAIFGFGGNGWGRNGNGLTQAELQQGFDTQSLLRGQEGIKNGLCDGFYAMNTTMLQGFNNMGRDVLENRFASQQCCCETNRNIDAVRYENARNTCDIVRAIEKDGEATRALMTQTTMQALRDKLADKDRDIQTRDFQLSQLSQNSTLINALNPRPIPAFPACPNNAFYGYGCNSY